MRFVNTAIITFSVFLTLGILTGHFFPATGVWVVYAIPALFIVLLIAWWHARNQLVQHIFFGIATCSCFFGIGYAQYQLKLPQFQNDHFSEFSAEATASSSEASSDLFQLKITEILKPDLFNRKYIAKVSAINGMASQGKLLASISIDTLRSPLSVDAVLLVSTKLQDLPKPSNPYQFKYGNYLRTLGVSHQVYFSSEEILTRKKGAFTFRGKASQFRFWLSEQLKKTPIDVDARAILQALILGERNELSNSLRAEYAAAGAIHILAVSGLHVGIVYALLLFLFRPLKNVRFGKSFQMVSIICCLWGFAFITGLSPSVTRAVTMFSFFAFAQSLDRPTNTINTLFLSYFVLLAANPLWLFQVGFQLSYLAVLFILLLHPKLSKMYKPRFYLDRMLWNIFTVSIAAQVGVLPLTLYYFHQFPSLFFITSLVILPFLGILLSFGIVVVLLAAFEILPEKVAIGYSFLIEQMNFFVKWIAQQEHFLFTDISLSEAAVLGLYLLSATCIGLWYRLSYLRLQSCLISVAIFTGMLLYERYESASNELVVFQKNRTTLLAYKHGSHLKIFSNDTLFQKDSYPIKDYRIGSFISTYSEAPLPKAFRFKNKNILIVDSSGVYSKHNEISVVLLTASPKVHLERLIDSVAPELIIADGSNYRSYVNRWRNTCALKKLPFYHTGSKGAFIAE